MSSREFAIELINKIPEYKIGYVVAYLQGLNDGETADDSYCGDLLNAYRESADKGDFVPFDEALDMCGVDINAIQD